MPRAAFYAQRFHAAFAVTHSKYSPKEVEEKGRAQSQND
jgi:hypothetical protein